ncbi:hypothetical protein F4782DRAFT_251403 [Xylaria castorea]|nr:hypothetical protein F4782DRAFT_251403 [Xylaria castorea]
MSTAPSTGPSYSCLCLVSVSDRHVPKPVSVSTYFFLLLSVAAGMASFGLRRGSGVGKLTQVAHDRSQDTTGVRDKNDRNGREMHVHVPCVGLYAYACLTLLWTGRTALPSSCAHRQWAASMRPPTNHVQRKLSHLVRFVYRHHEVPTYPRVGR